MTVIHTFGAVIEQLSLAFEIMVKCSHAGPIVTKLWIYFNAVILGNGNLFTLWNRIMYKVYSRYLEFQGTGQYMSSYQ